MDIMIEQKSDFMIYKSNKKLKYLIYYNIQHVNSYIQNKNILVLTMSNLEKTNDYYLKIESNIKEITKELKKNKNIKEISYVFSENKLLHQTILITFNNGHQTQLSVHKTQYGLTPFVCKHCIKDHQEKFDAKHKNIDHVFMGECIRNSTNGYKIFGFFDGRKSYYHDGIFGDLHKWLSNYPELSWGNL